MDIIQILGSSAELLNVYEEGVSKCTHPLVLVVDHIHPLSP